MFLNPDDFGGLQQNKQASFIFEKIQSWTPEFTRDSWGGQRIDSTLVVKFSERL